MPESPQPGGRRLPPRSLRLRSFRGVAWRNLGARKLRSLLTTCGIAVGIGLMFGTGLVTTTINETFHGLFDALYGRVDLVITRSSGSGSIKVKALEQVRADPGVKEAHGTLYEPVSRLKTKTVKRRVEVPAPPGAPPGFEPPPRTVEVRVPRPTGQPLNLVGIEIEAPPPANTRLTTGREPKRGRELSVEESWLRTHDLEVGDKVKLGLPAGAERFRIVGAYEYRSGNGVPGQSFGTIPMKAARKGFERPKGYDELGVVAHEGVDPRVLEERLQRLVGDGLIVDTPRTRSENVLDQLDALKVVLTIMSSLGAFVGTFLIFNAFSMTVLERQREIGMLRALGARRAAITRGILVEAVVLGVIGTAAGLALGYGLGAGMVRLAEEQGLPLAKLRFSNTALVVSIAAGLLLSILGALQPAWRAGRSSPLQAVAARREARRPPRKLRAAAGVVLIAAGAAGAWALTSGEVGESGAVVAGGLAVAVLFLGVALVAPFAIVPAVRPLVLPWRPVAPVESRLASNAITSNPMRSGVTATTLVVGLGLITAFGSISSSFLGSVERDLTATAGRDLTVQPRALDLTSSAPQQSFSPKLRERVAELPEAAVATPERFFFSDELVRGKEGFAFGLDPAQYSKVDSSTYNGGLRTSDVMPRLAAGEVTVSDSLARRLKVKRGDRITLRGSEGRREVTIAAIARSVLFGGQQIEMSLDLMKELYGVDRDSRLAIEARTEAERDALTRKVRELLEADYPQLQALSNKELKSEIDTRLRQQVGLFNVLLFIAVYTSLFGLTTTIAMSVFERTREIGVLRALGCSRWRVRRAIGAESLALALLGAVVGNAVGLALGFMLVEALKSLLPSIEYTLPLDALIAANATAVLLGLLASILPARRAARMSVTSALAYE